MNPPRNSPVKEFLAIELSVFLAQMAVICLVMWLLSGQMNSEEGLTKVLMARLDANTSKDFGYTLFALVSVFGLVAIAKHFLETGVIHNISSAVMDEFPRTIYFFGANLASASLMAGLYLRLYPSAAETPSFAFFLYSAFFGVLFFSAGCSLRYALNTKKTRRVNSAGTEAPGAA